MLKELIFLIGIGLITIGIIFKIISSIGLLRLPDFYLRLHAATINAVGGTTLSIVGVAILSLVCDFLGDLRIYVFGSALAIAAIILITSPVGSHVIARAAYKSKTELPKYIFYDELRKGESNAYK